MSLLSSTVNCTLRIGEEWSRIHPVGQLNRDEAVRDAQRWETRMRLKYYLDQPAPVQSSPGHRWCGRCFGLRCAFNGGPHQPPAPSRRRRRVDAVVGRQGGVQTNLALQSGSVACMPRHPRFPLRRYRFATNLPSRQAPSSRRSCRSLTDYASTRTAIAFVSRSLNSVPSASSRL